MPSKIIAESVRKLQLTRKALHESFPKWKFTLDGRLIGDIGEAYAHAYYDLDHLEGDGKVHDFKSSDGRLVQVKMTQKHILGLGINTPSYDYLLAFTLSADGNIQEVYNGKASRVYNRDGLQPRKSVSLKMLETFRQETPDKERIKLRTETTS